MGLFRIGQVFEIALFYLISKSPNYQIIKSIFAASSAIVIFTPPKIQL